jgi:CRISPR-associated protein Cas6
MVSLAPDLVPVDLVFELAGDTLPDDYLAALWPALVAQVPALAAAEDAGPLPVRASPTPQGLLLGRRARLALRVPRRAVEATGALTGRTIALGGRVLAIGAMRERPIGAAGTLKAAFVATGAGDELAHHEAVAQMLAAMDVPAPAIFGRMGEVRIGGHAWSGSPVVVHRLRAEASLALQYRGLGPHRQAGCGLFVPYKEIAGLD